MAGFRLMPPSARGFNLMTPASGFNLMGHGYRDVGGFLRKPGIPPQWRRGRGIGHGIKGIEWYNTTNPSPIGMGHYAPGITDQLGTKGVPWYVNMQETSDNTPPINTLLGSSRVNPTWDGNGIFTGPGGPFPPPFMGSWNSPYPPWALNPPPIIGNYGNGPFGDLPPWAINPPPIIGKYGRGVGYPGVNPVNGTNHSGYDPIYGYPLPQPKNIDFWNGKRMGVGYGLQQEEGCGLYNADIITSMIGAGMGDLLYQGSGFFDHLKTFFNTLFNKNKDPVSVGHTTQQGIFPEISPQRWNNQSLTSNFDRGFNNLKWSTNGFNDPFFSKSRAGKGVSVPGCGQSNWGGMMAVYDVLGCGLNNIPDYVKQYDGGMVPAKLMPQVCMMPDKRFVNHMTNYMTRMIDGSGAPPTAHQVDRWVGEGALKFFEGKEEVDRTGGFLDFLWDLTKKISPAGLIFKAITGHEFGEGVYGGSVDGGFLDALWNLTKEISPAGLLFKAITGHKFGEGVGGFSLGGIFSELGPLILGDLQKEFGKIGKGVDGSLGALFTAIGNGARPGKSMFGENAGGMCALLPCLSLVGNGINGRICKLGMMGCGPFLTLATNKSIHGGKIAGDDDYKRLLDGIASPSTPKTWMQKIGKFLTKDNISKVLNFLPTIVEGLTKTSAEFSKGKDADMKKLWGELTDLIQKGKKPTSEPRPGLDPNNMPLDATQDELKNRDWGEAAPPRGKGVKRPLTSVGGMPLAKICRKAKTKGWGSLYDYKTKDGGTVGGALETAMQQGKIPDHFQKLLAPLLKEPNSIIKALTRPDTRPEYLTFAHPQPTKATPLQPDGGVDIASQQTQFSNNTNSLYNTNPVLIGNRY